MDNAGTGKTISGGTGGLGSSLQNQGRSPASRRASLSTGLDMTIVRCPHCGVTARKPAPGRYRCPKCGIIIEIAPPTVDRDQDRTPSRIVTPPVTSEDAVFAKIRARKRRERSLRIILVLALFVIAAGLFTWLVFEYSMARRTSSGSWLRFLPDRNLARVRKYLHENTPTGKWEEIKWWSAREDPKTGKTICRLRYRTQLGFLGVVILDDVYEITDQGKVRLLHREANEPEEDAHASWFSPSLWE